jgi:DNA-binding response OmpR family regulator
MSDRPSALLVDDDARLAELLCEYLAKNDVAVTVAADGQEGLRAALSGRFDVVLLDLMLPGLDGLEVCRRIRAKDPRLPILMLTARGDDVERVVGLELGADDYLPKPFNPRELLARVRALLRRAQLPRRERARLQLGELTIDLDAREVRVGGAVKTLTSFEFELLAHLGRAAGRVLSREQLLELLKGEEFESFDRSIDVHISKLRAKLEDDPRSPRYIKTVRGVGYVLAAPEEG